eukprot:358353-Chlamydomonas_euryale.AAC.2
MLPGLASTCPRQTSSRLVPRSSRPTLSPAWKGRANVRWTWATAGAGREGRGGRKVLRSSRPTSSPAWRRGGPM